MPGVWNISADTGGTFTDCVGTAPDGTMRRLKILSTGVVRAVVSSRGGGGEAVVADPYGLPAGFWRGARASAGAGPGVVSADRAEAGLRVLTLDGAAGGVEAGGVVELSSGEAAPVLAARLMTGTGVGRALPALNMRVATTRGTNALLERRGRAVALFITRGFGDLLGIGTQQRPELFALDISKAAALHSAVVEVPERVGADGTVVEALDERAVAEGAGRVLGQGVRAAAVVLLHSWVNPAHERRVGAVLRGLGFDEVSVSSDLAPAIGVLARAQTTVINAYLSGVVGGFLREIGEAVGPGGGRLHVLSSAGSLLSAGKYRPKDSLLSGPAGGVVGAAAAARASGFARVITFDMGGTSTDAARIDGDQELSAEHSVGGATVLGPSVGVESVAAGGGSECWYDAGGHAGLRVGPRSAGADPGPACYGRGGPLTITDCNLLLGRFDGSRVSIPLDAGAARGRAEELAERVRRGTGESVGLEAMLEGLIDIANERMARAIHAVSVARGFEPADHALVAFGGAGPQHACAVAASLGIGTVIVPRDAGLLSAAGLAAAVVERMATRQVLGPLGAGEAGSARLSSIVRELGAEACGGVAGEGVASPRVVRVTFRLRLSGQEAAIAVDAAGEAGVEAGALAREFRLRFRRVYGYAPPERPIEVESVMVTARGGAAEGSTWSRGPGTTPGVSGEATPHRMAGSVFGGVERQTRVYERGVLRAGEWFAGPALVLEDHATTVVAPGWEARVDGAGALVLTRGGAGPETRGTAARPRAVRDGLFLARVSAIAEDMGGMLRRTSLSANVKERLDYSCAILDAEGRVVVNAPFIPVHLGALGECVRKVSRAMDLRPGDSVVTNHPGYGGSHLPDVTVITPVFEPGGGLLGYAASRAHHAEIGGVSPGSMPVGAGSLAEEGVVIAPMRLVREGVSRFEDVRRVLTGAPWPTRAVEENLADLQAQCAANVLGAARLLELARSEGAGVLRAGMAEIVERAGEVMRRALARLGDGRREACERLDDGSALCAAVSIAGGRAVLDFTGSAPVHPGSFNAPAGVVRSAVLYVLRLLIDEDLPLSEGLLAPVELIVPRGMLNPEFVAEARACPPVAAGNVETSQRVVDTLLKALGVAACSQGTMNNVVFGNERFGCYETVCGGAGATARAPGADAVHTHMTNTRITDAEVLERRFPVRIGRFAVRRGSGGAGRHRGGDGVVREYTFLEPVRLSLIGQHRARGAYGAAGGGPGRPGAQAIVGADGSVSEIGGVVSLEVGAGMTLRLETPGGGGWGPPG